MPRAAAMSGKTHRIAQARRTARSTPWKYSIGRLDLATRDAASVAMRRIANAHSTILKRLASQVSNRQRVITVLGKLLVRGRAVGCVLRKRYEAAKLFASRAADG